MRQNRQYTRVSQPAYGAAGSPSPATGIRRGASASSRSRQAQPPHQPLQRRREGGGVERHEVQEAGHPGPSLPIVSHVGPARVDRYRVIQPQAGAVGGRSGREGRAGAHHGVSSPVCHLVPVAACAVEQEHVRMDAAVAQLEAGIGVTKALVPHAHRQQAVSPAAGGGPSGSPLLARYA